MIGMTLLLASLIVVCPERPDDDNASLVVGVRHDLGFPAPFRGCPSDISWPDELEALSRIVAEFGESAYVTATSRMLAVTFDASGHPPEWFDDVAKRTEEIPGVLSAACLPAPELDPHVFYADGGRTSIAPLDWRPFVCDCSGETLQIDVVVSKEGTLLDPVFWGRGVSHEDAIGGSREGSVAVATFGPEAGPDCLECLREWVAMLRMEPARRLGLAYPTQVSIPARFEVSPDLGPRRE
ncbi:MAG: hypothetical protein R3E97_16880 [Candidatus Eisenbacteria bacterium]